MARKAPAKNISTDKSPETKSRNRSKQAELTTESKEELFNRVRGELFKTFIIALIAMAAGIGVAEFVRI